MLLLWFTFLLCSVSSSFYFNRDFLHCMATSPECNFEAETVRIGKKPCTCSLPMPAFPFTVEEEGLELVCRDKTTLTIRRIVDKMSTLTRQLFLIESSHGDLHPLIITTEILLTVTDLDPLLEYRFHCLDTSSNAKSSSQWLSSLSLPVGETPEPVVDITVSKFTVTGNEINAEIHWIPSSQRFCPYDFYWNSAFSSNKIEVREVEHLFVIVINGLVYEKHYDLLAISLYEEGNSFVESPTFTYTINVPSCFALNNNSIDLCVPDQLMNLSAQETLLGFAGNDSAIFNIEVFWDLPKVLPSEVAVVVIADSGDNISKTVNGNDSNVVFTDVEVKEFYIVIASAKTPAGNGASAKHISYISELLVPVDNTLNKLLPLAALLTFGLCAIAVIISFMRSKRKHYIKPLESIEDAESLVLPPIVNEEAEYTLIIEKCFEISREELILEGILGEGAFGVVRKGFLTRENSVTSVAVKSLKEVPTEEEKYQFVGEILMLQSLDKHPHVVSMIGCVNANLPEDMLLVVEFCEHGDLQRYLQNSCTALLARCSIEPITSHDYANWSDPKTKGVMVNRLYEAISRSGRGKNLGFFTTNDLLRFALQVADGMEFLSLNRIIHRDLAARNILITSRKTIKISDFGLSRDVYENNYYVKMEDGKLPCKWMAIESLLHQKYTTQSDVWSFGVLLWEIMTYGSMPYCNMAPYEVIQFLTSGRRLPRPENTSHALYNVMLTCWELNPHERPRFNELKNTLFDLLESE